MVKLNKKGYGIIEAMAVIGIALMIVFFTILLQLRGCVDTPEQKIEPDSLKDLKLEYDLVAFLNTPVDYKGNSFNVADLITLSLYNDQDSENLVNEDVYSTNIFTTEEPYEYINALNGYYERDKGKNLTTASIDFMRTYASFVPASVSKSYYCSISVVAEEYDQSGTYLDSIRLFDTTYKGLVGQLGGCSIEFYLAEVKIPSPNGYISVQLKSKFNAAKLVGQVAATTTLVGLSPVPGAFLAYYLWY